MIKISPARYLGATNAVWVELAPTSSILQYFNKLYQCQNTFL